MYVRLERELQKDPHGAAASIIAALRRGDFFNVIEALAPANGFENYYLEKDGRHIAMGGEAQAAGGALIFKLPFDFATDIAVKKDGETFRPSAPMPAGSCPFPSSPKAFTVLKFHLPPGALKNSPGS